MPFWLKVDPAVPPPRVFALFIDCGGWLFRIPPLPVEGGWLHRIPPLSIEGGWLHRIPPLSIEEAVGRLAALHPSAGGLRGWLRGIPPWARMALPPFDEVAAWQTHEAALHWGG
eukprot:11158511-Lingulodinium_polyedra.AAC.1